MFSFLPVSGSMTGDTGSRRSWDRAKDWLRTCQRDHMCSVKSPDDIFLPHRVLDLQAHCPSKIALYETEAERGIYACLSHRWGTSQPLKTTKDRIKCYQDEIPEADLPQTFRDAIAFVRHLDIRYLWVDSLCIIQDDDNDWKQQASLMAQIYRYSTITLAATASNDANSGLFRQNENAIDDDLSTLTGNLDHKGILFTSGEEDKYHGISGRPDLLTRGWVMQERILSPRLLHFNDELVFECSKRRWCECRQSPYLDLPIYFAPKDSCDATNLEFLDIPELYKRWCWLVTHYSTMQLTVSSDILPAISGLAGIFHKYFRGRYMAGLWENVLIHELAWKIVTPRSCTRRSPWAAPTFSWASVCISRPSPEEILELDYAQVHVGNASDIDDTAWGVQWVRGINNDIASEQTTEKCEVIDMGCTLAGSDPRGQITEAYIVLKGLLYPTIVEGLNKVSSYSHLPLKSHYERERFYADYDYTQFIESEHGVTIGTQLYCFVLQSQRATSTGNGDWICSLVLRKVGDYPGAEGIFERVGVLDYQSFIHRHIKRRQRQGKTLLEELKERAGDGIGIVVDAIVKIV
jgi:hypothetical protein